MPLKGLIYLFFNIDSYIIILIEKFGIFSYIILFLIIFAETGLVIAPFLPGDSLLFILGAIAVQGTLNIYLLFLVLILAAVLGDTVNYWIGKYAGEKITKKNIIKKEHLEKTQKFYERYGGKTIILARFIPIIRTFAPFVAGIGKMNYNRFLSYNIIGGIIWVTLFLFAGYFFGEIPLVKENLTAVIIFIIIISFILPLIEYIKTKKDRPKV